MTGFHNATSDEQATRPVFRTCREDEQSEILKIINAAAEAYRGVIPADCWHEPYMSLEELRAETAAGVAFAGCEIDGSLKGVMGIQSVRNVSLVRHAYVVPECQGQRVGSGLIRRLLASADKQVLVGTWAAATWAIGFYQKHGFGLLPEDAKAKLLRTYWTVSERQIETSVVLAAPHLTATDASQLIQ